MMTSSSSSSSDPFEDVPVVGEAEVRIFSIQSSKI